MKYIATILLIILSYFIGNISPATILAKLSGHDIKKEGSGNAGTTNVLRVVGKKAAAITLLIDVGKGIIATLLGYYTSLSIWGVSADSNSVSTAMIVSGFCGLAVFLGHVWPVLLKFQGGKGVATALGVLLATNWKLALICLLIFAIVVAISKMVSLGSLTAALAFFILLLIQNFIQRDAANTQKILLTILPYFLMVLTLFIKHSDNIDRIIKGNENKLDLRKKN